MNRPLILLIFILSSCTIQEKKNEVDNKIDQLISQMTLEEKIGQMAQINITVITDGPDKWNSYEPLTLDTEKVKKAILKYKIGSVLNTANNQARSPKLWNQIIGEIQKTAMIESRLGIPIIYGIDGMHGATYTSGATIFPQQITT